jgi:sec-independent protein translocase protein TatA
MGLDNPLHIAFLLVVLLLVFGAKRLPEMGKSLGSGLRGFKGALADEVEPAALGSAATTAPEPALGSPATTAPEPATLGSPATTAPQPAGERTAERLAA